MPSLSDSASEAKARLGIPDEPQTGASLAPGGEALGFEAHFAPDGANTLSGGFGGGGFGAPKQNEADASSRNNATAPGAPSLAAPTTNAERAADLEKGGQKRDFVANGANIQNSPGRARTQGAPPASPARKDKNSTSTNDAPPVVGSNMARNGMAPAFGGGASIGGRGQQQNRVVNPFSANTFAAPLLVSVSVASPILNARITGRIQGKTEEEVVLWTGNLAARQPVSISLTPLGGSAGDEVQLAVEQQVAVGQTKKLATTSVVWP